MDALIIAAGFGSRLRDVSDSKPLTPISGIPLLELGARQARAAGAERVVVVTGHEAERIEAALPSIADRAGLPVVAQRVADWTKPNGWSVIAGAEVIAGNYLLMMSDHIFSAPILAGLARQGSADRGVTLAIDRRCDNPLVDPDDATWVQTDARGFIRAIGKTIPDYDAVDCGAFLATPELAEAIRTAIAAGKAGSLSEGMQRLADAGRAATWDIGTAWWLDVDDPRAFELAEAQAPAELPEVYTRP
ncbi:NTP transferase domain-containing protein [Novosphingobium sp.]|uniref:phosphocholine cytidylyltransferase family protein n=1 Tax=Novosphingobium sp. TaxID=1874826 RepID=UPI0022BF08FB|nr:NTP transferase domain-containing protein [Novosphingobium sp.]MCZ8019109.1 NTP transferase domain-containing protein [Novosphingobium sp.]MCZ8034917.1 NTP transferase domain-containing protein [Novosphingobium sp.]MCZ8052485.1 NTP transferase domain-containing protein [Novosphingobium sp.]MCZ8058584.1 NTP transferase domain-containing protein [Novosphingobium sp.]MCZ8232981.1 NTP transferase domain-containing protein [Novosphingobium sp.]